MKDRSDLELHAYYTNPSHDEISQRLLGNFKTWNVVCALSDLELANVITKDGIDILIDLSGHTGLNRLPAFARSVLSTLRVPEQTVKPVLQTLPNGIKLRTDVSVTLFISDPSEYDGGELVIEDTYGVQQVKLPAGDMIVYPATSLHQVTPVTRGVRVASFLWVQSLVRSDTQRALLFDMDTAIQRLNATHADDAARRSLVGCYHNLLRTWSET